jgi:OsmC-like protein.
VTLAALEVTVDSESDDRGILGASADVPSGPLSTRVAVRLRAVGASDDQLRQIVDWAVEHCPVTDAVRRAIPMTVEMTVETAPLD